jgi:hypothetical protein
MSELCIVVVAQPISWLDSTKGGGRHGEQRRLFVFRSLSLHAYCPQQSSRRISYRPIRPGVEFVVVSLEARRCDIWMIAEVEQVKWSRRRESNPLNAIL